ncbi:globin [Arthrobacter rhombi]|uniref:globin n=1 Tax=Arthrobacter rhombi TaxID=71253 RepID=UPI003FD566EA
MSDQQNQQDGPIRLPGGESLGIHVGQAGPLSSPSVSPGAPGGHPENTDASGQSPDRFGGTTPASADVGDHEDLSPYLGTFYAEVGGSKTFQQLTEYFYESVANDAEFRSIYPEEDLKPAAIRLQLFLEQYWGGPTTYSQLRGHPRLRMRHVPYIVDTAARDTWLAHMRHALDRIALPPLQDATIWDYFDRAARSLQNAADS